MEDLTRDTLADTRTLMSYPPRLRPGHTELIYGQQPAAAASYVHTVPNDWWERIIGVAFTLTTSATAGSRSLALNYADANGTIFNQTPLAYAIQPSQQVTAYGDLKGTTPIQAPESFSTYATAAAPAAGATIASLTVPQGDYTVSWTVQLDGTPAAGDNNNFGLYLGSGLLLQAENGVTAGQPYPQPSVDVEATGVSNVIAVKAIAAGSASSIYAAQLTATPAATAVLQLELPDFTLKSGWVVTVALGNGQSGDQLGGIILVAERYASNYADGSLFSDEERLARAIARAIREGI